MQEAFQFAVSKAADPNILISWFFWLTVKNQPAIDLLTFHNYSFKYLLVSTISVFGMVFSFFNIKAP